MPDRDAESTPDHHAESSESRPQRAVTGVVLAGGRSTRFAGGDKALAAVDGEPMLVRVATALADATDAVVVNCRADQRDAFERALDDAGFADAPVRFAVDDHPDEGPLLGLSCALDVVDAPVVLVVACDLPWVTAALLEDLVGSLDAADQELDAVVPVDDDGYRKPTCAAYRAEPHAAAVEATVDRGSRRLTDVLDSLRVRDVGADAFDWSSRALVDVDSRADLEEIEAAADVDE